MAFFDPYIYGYMRSFGTPPSHYPAYLASLTPPQMRRFRPRAIPAQTSDPNTHPAQLSWVTPDILVLSKIYLETSTPIEQARTHAHATKQRLLDAAPGRARAGAARAHLHALSQLLAALVREWDAHQRVQAVRLPAVTSPAHDAERAAKRKLAREREQRKRLRHERAIVEVEWLQARLDYADARRECARTRGRFQGMLGDLRTTRARLHYLYPTEAGRRHVAGDILFDVRLTRSEYRKALLIRKAVYARYRECKAAIRKLRTKHASKQQPTS